MTSLFNGFLRHLMNVRVLSVKVEVDMGIYDSRVVYRRQRLHPHLTNFADLRQFNTRHCNYN
jgi:hypothetical protein